jgi:hypothetical protein
MRDSLARMVAEQEHFEENISKKVEAELAEIRKAHDEKVEQIRSAFSDLRQQISRLESVAGPKARLAPEDLGQLRQLVATLGTLLQEQGVAKPYPGIYMDITRLTGVSRSEDIRRQDFPEVVEFLEKTDSSADRKDKTGRDAGFIGCPVQDRYNGACWFQPIDQDCTAYRLSTGLGDGYESACAQK